MCAPAGKSLQLERAINCWEQWGNRLSTRPVLVRPLEGGLSNRSYLLDSAGRQMVLRLNNGNTMLPGLNRHSESQIWQAASAQEIAPPLLHLDEHAGYLVSTYINNDLSAQTQHDKRYVELAFELLNRCHQLDVDVSDIEYASHIEQYWQKIESKNHPSNSALTEQREPMRKTLEALLDSNAPTGLCHHDPVVANFVGNPKKLYLIDWEYAARGLLVMDYAALAAEWEIDDATIQKQTGIKPELLSNAKALYGYLCSLWEEATT
jgi:thiamine kinase-like enzyme